MRVSAVIYASEQLMRDMGILTCSRSWSTAFAALRLAFDGHQIAGERDVDVPISR